MIHTTIAKQINKYVENNKEILTTFLSNYLSYDSTNPDLEDVAQKSECHQWLANELRSLDLFDEVDYWELQGKYSNLVAIKKGRSPESILYCGHTDTVPVTASQLQEWRSDAGPWSGHCIEGKIFGRGATDMKGGNASALMAVKVLHDLGIPLERNSIFGFVMTEESGNREYGVDSIIQRGYSAKSAVVMEPTHLCIVPAVQGEFYFKITIKGKSSHIASRHLSIYPHRFDVESIPGVNAIDIMRELLDELANLEKQLGLYYKHDLMDPGATTINISKISSKGIFSALAEECYVVGSMIYAPSITQDEAIDEFTRAVDRVTEKNWWLRKNPPTLELPYFLSAKPPVNLKKDHWLCKTLDSSLIDNGLPVVYDAMVSTSDANYLIDHGFDVVTFGPGASHMGMHGYNEYIPQNEYLDAIKVLASFMARKKH